MAGYKPLHGCTWASESSYARNNTNKSGGPTWKNYFSKVLLLVKKSTALSFSKSDMQCVWNAFWNKDNPNILHWKVLIDIYRYINLISNILNCLFLHCFKQFNIILPCFMQCKKCVFFQWIREKEKTFKRRLQISADHAVIQQTCLSEGWVELGLWMQWRSSRETSEWSEVKACYW